MSAIDCINWDKQSATTLINVLSHISSLQNDVVSNIHTTSIIGLINWTNISAVELEELRKHIVDLVLVKGLSLHERNIQHTPVQYPPRLFPQVERRISRDGNNKPVEWPTISLNIDAVSIEDSA